MHPIVITACVAVALSQASPLLAQATPDSARAARRNDPYTRQEISDACNHKTGARARLYGCRAEGSLGRGGDPLFVLDGRPLPTDTAGPGRVERESAMRGIRVGDIADVTLVRPPASEARYGAAARFGVIVITTKREAAR